MVSIVIPAHNEGAVIGQLLTALTRDAPPVQVVVVANGCTDDTAAVASGMPGVTVLETPVPSKIKALALGDRVAESFPRLYVDGDVVLGAADVQALCAALDAPGVCAAGPTRVIPMDGVGWAVRRYYEVWQQLPGVRHELYGRGVIAVDCDGHRRIAGWPEVMSDDLLVAMSFTPEEVAVVDTARVLIRPPRRYADLLRRRVRAMTGNYALSRRTAVRGAGAGAGTLARLAWREPRSIPGIVIFTATALLAKARGRVAAARGSTVWLRDESSRDLMPDVAITTPEHK